MATLVALLGAMFVALPSASAVSLNDCNPTAPTTMGIGDMCTVEVGSLSSPDDVASGGTPPSNTDYVTSSNDEIANVDASGVVTAGTTYGTATITVVDYTAANAGATPPVAESTKTTTYRVTTAKIAVTKVEFGAGEGADFIADTDNVFKAGTDVVLRLTISHANADGEEITTVVSVPTTGLSLKATAGGTTQRESDTDTTVSATAGQGSVTTTDFVLITDGAPDGEYEVTATASQGSADTLVTSAKFPAKLRIGDAGNAVDEATLTLGLSAGYDTATDATDDKPENGSDTETGEVNLVLSVLNGIGNPVNASDVHEVRIVAPFGDVKYFTGPNADDFMDPDDDNTIPGKALRNGSVIVQIGSRGDAARTIDVYAIVLGSASGVATTETVPLTFTGPAASMTVDDATKTLRNVNVEKDDNLVDDTITLVVNAMDKSGNSASPPLGLSITISDPDGNAVSTGASGTIDASQPAQGKDGKWRITVTNVSGDSASSALKTGVYTLKAKSGSIEDTAMFTVAGAVDTITVDVDEMSPTELGQGLTVTAMVVDGDGAAAADDTHVNFESSDDKIAKRVGTSGNVNTKDGAASATFVVTGPGLVVITASTGGKTDSVVVNSSAGMVEPEAMPEEEASVSCLSELSGFATWSCGVAADASEIFGMVSARGVSAIHLWNGSTWVRYSVVDDAMVPGSSDFMVTENDILYISN